jgi:transposase InsO family protein
MAEHMQTELVLTALETALGHRSAAASGLLFHSDRGSQYASGAYRAVLKDTGISCSMSRRGNCWDNAVAESFFGTMKTELIHLQNFATREDVRCLSEPRILRTLAVRVLSINPYLPSLGLGTHTCFPIATPRQTYHT